MNDTSKRNKRDGAEIKHSISKVCPNTDLSYTVNDCYKLSMKKEQKSTRNYFKNTSLLQDVDSQLRTNHSTHNIHNPVTMAMEGSSKLHCLSIALLFLCGLVNTLQSGTSCLYCFTLSDFDISFTYNLVRRNGE